MDSLLLEIGVEEIPAGYIKPAVEALALNLSKQLLNNRIGYGFVQTFATPRRLAVLVKDVAEKQESITEQVYGPPEKIAFNSDGSYSIPAIKFAEKIDISLDRLEVVSTYKGRYLSGKRIELGQSTRILMKTVLPDLLLTIPFPKSMRWSNLSISFARPIRSIVALLGDSVIDFVFGNIKSGRNSTGHLFMSTGNLSLYDPDNYSEIMKKVNVIADLEERRNITYEAVNKAAVTIGGKVITDDKLLDIVNNLVEFPIAVAGKFDELYLDMPKEILVTAMSEHQKYFSVVDDSGDLLPGFIAVSNTLAKNMKLVTIGHERVLRARLSDANFFYDSDIMDSIESWVEKLKGVLFHAKLGSMYDKALRLKKITLYLASVVAPNLREEAVRAAYLCKADLVSQVVIEFPSLQGTMGTIYANLSGESDKVSKAIQEHYLPTKSGGKLPNTKVGALISIADKIDSICGCFSIGLSPTGTTDPYALRRQSIGLLRIIRSMSFNLSLENLVKHGVELYAILNKINSETVVKEICVFLRDRFARLLSDEGYSADIIAAVISISMSNIFVVEKRVIALQNFRRVNGFGHICAAFKRIDNILRKSEITLSSVSEDLFENDSEFTLYKNYLSANDRVELLLDKNNTRDALEVLVTLCDPVDVFFNQVMIMVPDEKICRNRLALLTGVSEVFLKIANFSKIST